MEVVLDYYYNYFGESEEKIQKQRIEGSVKRNQLPIYANTHKQLFLRSYLINPLIFYEKKYGVYKKGYVRSSKVSVTTIQHFGSA